MDAKEYIKEFNRMCSSMDVDCDKCPVGGHMQECADLGCEEYQLRQIDIVEKWSKEHPAITNRYKFIEIFGDNGNEDVNECGKDVFLTRKWLDDKYDKQKRNVRNKLTDIDLIELRDRFGDDVRDFCLKYARRAPTEDDIQKISLLYGEWVAFVVEDMVTVKDERWRAEGGIFDP